MKPTPALISSFAQSRLGKALDENSIRAIIEASEPRKKAKGATLFREAEAGAGLYFLVSGSVKLIRTGADGRESLLHFAESPAVIAEGAIFFGKFPATGVAVTDVQALFLSREKAFDLIERNGRFARFLLEGMALWLGRMVRRIEELTLSDATARLARFLLDQLGKIPAEEASIRREQKVTLPLKKGELALLLNMHQPSLSRIFRKLQDEEIISVRGRSIILLNVAALKQLTLPPLEM